MLEYRIQRDDSRSARLHFLLLWETMPLNYAEYDWVLAFKLCVNVQNRKSRNTCACNFCTHLSPGYTHASQGSYFVTFASFCIDLVVSSGTVSVRTLLRAVQDTEIKVHVD